MAIKFETEYLDYHHGQHDVVLRAVDDDGEVMGSLWFTEYGDEISVKMVESSPNYKKKQPGLGSGIGRVLVRKLQTLYPETEIKPGMTTEEGSRLLKALPRRYDSSPVYDRLQARLDETNIEIERIEKMYEDWHALPEEEQELSREEILKYSDRFNRLYDLSRKLKNRLEGRSPGKWVVTHREFSRVPRLARRLVSQLEDLYVHEEPIPGIRSLDNSKDIRVIKLEKTRKKLEEWFKRRDIPVRVIYTGIDLELPDAEGHQGHKPNITPIGKQGVITYAYLPVGDGQEPPTAWMVVHNLSHALFEPTHYYHESPHEIYKTRSLHVGPHPLPTRWEKEHNLMGKDQKRPALYPTTKSQQRGKIYDPGEAFHELFTQWVVKGRVILNPRRPEVEKSLGSLFRAKVDEAAESGAVVYNL